MNLSSYIMKNYFNKYRFFAVVIVIGLLPVAGFSQEADEQQVQDLPQVESTPSSSSSSGLSTSPWPGNNSNSSSTTTNQTQQQRPSTNPALRPVGGNTVLDDPGPGGNPDVPFDDNMNLGFLAVGVVFAFVVLRKRLMNKPVTVSK